MLLAGLQFHITNINTQEEGYLRKAIVYQLAKLILGANHDTITALRMQDKEYLIKPKNIIDNPKRKL